jgi:hypothetical protein
MYRAPTRDADCNRLEGIVAAAGLDGDPFYFGHFVGGPATAFAAHSGIFYSAKGNCAFIVDRRAVEVDHAGF